MAIKKKKAYLWLELLMVLGALAVLGIGMAQLGLVVARGQRAMEEADEMAMIGEEAIEKGKANRQWKTEERVWHGKVYDVTAMTKEKEDVLVYTVEVRSPSGKEKKWTVWLPKNAAPSS